MLILLEDGDFEDFDDVPTLICGAADVPLSIVLVGVGNCNCVQFCGGCFFNGMNSRCCYCRSG